MSQKPVPTPFGKFVRNLRIERNEYMKDMAKRLDVSTAYLSSVEIGRRNPPNEWANRLVALYGLSDSDGVQLEQAIRDSRSYENLNVAHLSAEDRRLTRLFVEKLPKFSDDRRALLTSWLEENV